MQHFEHSSWIGAPVESVFGFHERPDALELLTPRFPPVRVVRRGGSLAAGTEVELRIGFGPLAARWVAHHVAYEPGRLFVDEQREGPFAEWVHTHTFTAENGGTRLRDSVEYALPGGALTEALLGWAVRRQLRGMFRHRHAVTRGYCEGAAA